MKKIAARKTVEAKKAVRPAPKPETGERPDGFTDFHSALAWLEDRINVERSRPDKVNPDAFKLDRMHALADALGNPHRSIRTVHVAGSKGKGSVCEMTAACLQGCGYTTGLYTSPHLIDVRERVRINQQLIPEAEFTRHLARAAEAAKTIEKKHGPATYFELLTALAFLHFAEQAVDIAVIEVGLGGRLDATNIITPEAVCVTAIYLEHTQLLGKSLEQIAREKAGIFKPGVPALTYPQSSPAVIEAFREAAARVGCTLKIVGDDIDFSHRFEASPELGPHCRVSLTTPRSQYEHMVVPLRGEHQAWNCGLALAALDSLRERGLDLPERPVAQGLARTAHDGRFDVVSQRPRIIVDGAHNPESVGGLIKAIGAHARFDSMVMIFGCASDKDIYGMLAKVATGADKIIFTRATGNVRGIDPRELARKFNENHQKMVQVAPTPADALRIAERAVGRDDVIVATGSFYIAGEIKKLVRARGAAFEPKPVRA